MRACIVIVVAAFVACTATASLPRIQVAPAATYADVCTALQGVPASSSVVIEQGTTKATIWRPARSEVSPQAGEPISTPTRGQTVILNLRQNSFSLLGDGQTVDRMPLADFDGELIPRLQGDVLLLADGRASWHALVPYILRLASGRRRVALVAPILGDGAQP